MITLLAAVLVGCSAPPDPAPTPTTASGTPRGGPQGPPLTGPGPQGPPLHGGPPPGAPPGGGPSGGGFKASVSFEPTPASGPQRSLLVISLDTVRADHLGVYGGRAETPSLDALGTQGARFTTALSHFPETCQSHWAMLSGVLPQVHGNIPANGGSLYTGPTLAELAGQAGLATGAFIGGLTLQDSMCGLSRGFDHYDDWFDFRSADTRPGPQVVQAATAWMGAQDGPWFAFVHFFDAHSPYTPEAPWDTRYDPDYTGTITGELADLGVQGGTGGRSLPQPDLDHVVALYDGELSQLDGVLAPLLAAAGDDTIVVVTSDHGESFEHDYFFNHRAGLWDSVLRVPWLIRGPGVAPGTVVDIPVSLIDLVPTVTELAGLPGDRRVQGLSRVGLLRGESGSPRPHCALTDPWMPEPQFAVRTPATKVIWQPRASLVYDLASDPLERQPGSTVPAALEQARQACQDRVTSLASHQAAAPQRGPMLSPEERARLEALGYVDRPPEGTPPPR